MNKKKTKNKKIKLYTKEEIGLLEQKENDRHSKAYDKVKSVWKKAHDKELKKYNQEKERLSKLHIENLQKIYALPVDKTAEKIKSITNEVEQLNLTITSKLNEIDELKKEKERLEASLNG